MARPTSLTGWWYDLLVERANENVMLLADMCDATPRTLNRWHTGEIALPDKDHRKLLRKIAGEELLNRKGCPKYLRLRPKNVD